MAKLLTYDGQVIDPTAYMLYISLSFSLTNGLSLSQAKKLTFQRWEAKNVKLFCFS